MIIMTRHIKILFLKKCLRKVNAYGIYFLIMEIAKKDS